MFDTMRMGASGVGEAYEIERSLRFDVHTGTTSGAHLQRTFGSAGNRKTWTFSAWIKKQVQSSGNYNLFDANDGSSARTQILIDNNNLRFYASSPSMNVTLNRKLRDPSAWYHICVAVDTTQSTDTNRVKFYINNTQETSFSSASWYSQNDDGLIGDDEEHGIGIDSLYDNQNFDGYMAEVCFINGSALTPSSFGEYDEDSPTIWKPKDVSGLTFGTNGFYLDFEDSSNLGNDANGGTDWSENSLAATDQATDTPTNNFATLNPLDAGSEATLSEGNCKYTGGTTVGEDQRQVCGGTFGVSKGKWYYEVKKISNDATVGIYAAEHVGANIGYTSVWGSAWNNLMLGCFTQSGNAHSGTASTSYGDSLADDEILGVALDLDNGAIYFSEEGTFYDSGDPTSGASKTGAASNFSTSVDTWIIPFIGDGSSGLSSVYEFNFGGCPAFTVSSGNSDANGYGNFEFAVPSGYYAPCSKNLAEFG